MYNSRGSLSGEFIAKSRDHVGTYERHGSSHRSGLHVHALLEGLLMKKT